jgi:hypothetical protein
MNLTIQIPPGLDDTTALMSHTARRPLFVIRMIGGCFVGLAVLFSVALVPEPPGILGLALVILFFVLMAAFRRRFQATLPSNFTEPGVLTITDENLTLVRGPVTTIVRWEAVDSVKPVMHLWAIRYCDQSLMAIPQAVFSAVDDARWREFLRTRGLSGTAAPRAEETSEVAPARAERSSRPVRPTAPEPVQGE